MALRAVLLSVLLGTGAALQQVRRPTARRELATRRPGARDAVAAALPEAAMPPQLRLALGVNTGLAALAVGGQPVARAAPPSSP